MTKSPRKPLPMTEAEFHAEIAGLSDDPDTILFADYLAGELSPDEVIVVEDRLAHDAAFAAWAAPLAEFHRLPRPSVPAEQLERVWAQFSAKVGLPIRGTSVDALHRTHDVPRRACRVWWQRILERLMRGTRWATGGLGQVAMVIVSTVALTTLFLTWFSHHTLPTVRPTQYRTPLGERVVVTLADGSTVALAGGSLLTEPRSVALPGRRYVRLTGEGTFHITTRGTDTATRTANRFVVQTPMAVITVTGTVFTAHWYTGDSATIVTVREGTVSVLPDGGSLSTAITGITPTTLHAGDRARVTVMTTTLLPPLPPERRP